MPIDPRSYFIQTPQMQGPLDAYREFMSLRDMMDRRRYNDMQMRRLQLQERDAEQEYQERLSFQRDFTGQETPEEIFRRWPTYGPKVLKAHGEALTQQRLADKAGREATEAQTKLDQVTRERALNELSGIRSVADPETQGQMFMEWQARNPRLGRGVTWPLNDRGFEFLGKSVLGPTGYQDYATKVAEAKQKQEDADRDKTLDFLNIEEKQWEQAGRRLGGVTGQPSWEQFRGSLPPGIRAQTNPMYSPAEHKRVAQMMLTAQERATEAGQAATREATLTQQRATQEGAMRDDFRQESKNYLVMRDGFQRVKSSSASNTGAGDLAMLYGFMKLLDPNSVVRETEFQMAQSAGSIPERMRAAWLRVISGQRLDPDVRAQFVKEAEAINRQNTADHAKMSGTYRRIAERGGLNPENVVVDYSAAEPEPAPEQQTGGTQPAMLGGIPNPMLNSNPPVNPAAPKAEVPTVGAVVEGDDGSYLFSGGNPNDRKNWKKVKSK